MTYVGIVKSPLGAFCYIKLRAGRAHLLITERHEINERIKNLFFYCGNDVALPFLAFRVHGVRAGKISTAKLFFGPRRVNAFCEGKRGKVSACFFYYEASCCNIPIILETDNRPVQLS